MTDNAMVYRNSRRFGELLSRQQLHHIRKRSTLPFQRGV